MPIVVDHTPSGLTSVIAAGLAAAENQRKLELADKLGLETRRLDIAQQGQDLDQRRFEAQQADLPLARQHAADMVNLQYDRLGQRDQQQSQLRVQEAQQRADAMLSPMQQSQLKKLDEQELMVNSAPTLMPAAKEMMLAQIDQKRHTIRNQKGGSRPSPFPEGRDVGDVWEDASGAVFSRDKDGNVKLLVRPDQRKGAAADDRKNPEMFRKRYDAVTKRLTTRDPATDISTPPTRDQVLAALREEDQAFSEYAGTPVTTNDSAADTGIAGPPLPTSEQLAIANGQSPVQPQQAAQMRALAGRLEQQMELQRIVPPEIRPWVESTDPNKTFPGIDGHEYTLPELTQIAMVKKIPLPEVIKRVIRAPEPKASAPTAAPKPSPAIPPGTSVTAPRVPVSSRFNPRE